MTPYTGSLSRLDYIKIKYFLILCFNKATNKKIFRNCVCKDLYDDSRSPQNDVMVVYLKLEQAH